MENYFTNNVDLCRTINLDYTVHALFTNAADPERCLIDHNVLNRADKVFLIGSESNYYDLVKKYHQRPNFFVWDSVLDSTLPNYRLFLDHWDRVSLLDREFDLTGKLTNPLIQSPAYRFDVLLGNERPHRKFIYDKILSSALSNQFLVSYYRVNEWIPGTDENDYDTLAKLKALGHDFERYGGQNYEVPLVTPLQLTYNLCQPIPWKIFNRTWFSIIAETVTSKNFVTEKIGKALAANRIFVTFGAVGMLAELKKLGFETFDSIIDETYDSEPHDAVRWSMAWQQVEKLCVLDPKQTYAVCQAQLKHNHALFSQLVQEHNWGAVVTQVKQLLDSNI